MIENEELLRRYPIYIVLLITYICIICGCDYKPVSTGTKQYGVISPTISPDNESIVLALVEVPGQSNIAIYNIASKQWIQMNPTGKDCLAPVYSPDGKMMVFTSGDGDDKNIFIMNADGTGLRQLTHTVNDKSLRKNGDPVVKINALPSFSPDGKRIIYVRSGVRRQRSTGGEMVSHWDVYELEIATKNERQLTAYEFYDVTSPFYLSDGKRFIFSGYGPKGVSEGDFGNLNSIRLMDGVKNSLVPPFQHATWASSPTIADDGTIVFVSRTDEMDGTRGNYTYDLFVHQGGGTRRLTTMRYAIITEPFLSHDGQFVVYLASKTRKEGPSIWLAKVDGTETQYIGRPWKQTK